MYYKDNIGLRYKTILKISYPSKQQKSDDKLFNCFRNNQVKD